MEKHDERLLLDAIACRAAASIEDSADAPDAAAAVIRAFEPAATPMPAFELYQRLREAEHLCAARAPRVARRLARLGRLVERCTPVHR